MARAYVRVCITPGQERRIRNSLRQLSAVHSADITAGEQDMIALLEGDTFEAILKTVVEQIRPLEGVRITWTNFVVDE